MFARVFTLKRTIVLIITVFFVVLLSFFAYMIMLQENVVRNAERYLNESAQQGASAVNARFDLIFQQLESLESEIVMDNELSTEQAKVLVGRYSFSFVQAHLFYFDENGDAYARYSGNFSVKDRDYFKSVMENNRSMKNLSTSYITNEPSVSLVVPVTNGKGVVVGGIGASYNPEGLGEILKSQAQLSRGFRIVLQPDGTVVYHPNHDFVGKHISSIIDLGSLDLTDTAGNNMQALESEEARFYQFLDNDGYLTFKFKDSDQEYVSSYATTQHNGWMVVSVYEADFIRNQYINLYEISFFFCMLIIALMIIMFVYIFLVVRRSTNQVLQVNKKTQSFISGVPGGVFKLDLEKLVMSELSDGMYRLFDMARPDFYDKYRNRFSDIILEQDKDFVLRSLDLSDKLCEMEFGIKNVHGEIKHVFYRASVAVEDGKKYHYVLLSDVTETRKAQQDITAYRSELAALTDSIPGGVATLIVDDMLSLRNINDGFFILCGYSRELFEASFNNALKPFLQKSATNKLLTAIEAQSKSTTVIEAEVKIKGKKGNAIYILIRGSRTNDINGYPAYQAVFIDITQQHKIRKEIEIERERMRIIATFTSLALFEYDVKEKRIVNFYSSQENTDASVSIVYDDYIQQLISSVYKEDKPALDAFRENLKQGTDNFTAQMRTNQYSSDSAEYKWISFECKTVYDEHGEPFRVVARVSDIDEVKRSTEYLKASAQRDPLTGLYNKRVTERKIEKFLDKANAEEGEMSGLIMIDLDNFKAVNDNFGHLFGDSVLKTITSKLQNVFRSEDIVGRVGGDEFLVFAKNIKSLDMLQKKAEQICQVFYNTYEAGDLSTTISSSIGIACFPNDGTSYNELYEKADKALYKSKIDGKNRYNFYDENQTYERNAAQLQRNEHTETAQDKTLLSASTDNIFISDIVNALYGQPSTDEAMRYAFSLIADHFNADDVEIHSFTNKGFYQLEYSILTATLDEQHYVRGEVDDLLDLFDQNGLLYCTDIELYKDKAPYIHCGLMTRKVKAYLQALIKNGEDVIGVMSLTNIDKQTVWTQAQVDSFLFISKIVGAYYIKSKIDSELIMHKTLDPLTGAWTLGRFIEEMNLRLEGLKSAYYLLHIDVRGFKQVNENFGFSEGDRLLALLSAMIGKDISGYEKYARAGDDSFIILLKYENDAAILERFSRYSKAISGFEIGGKTDKNAVVIKGGACVLPIGESNINPYIDKAIRAKKVIESPAKSVCVIYNQELQMVLDQKSQLEAKIIEDLSAKAFVPFYQPKVRISDGRIVGAEALARWLRSGEISLPKDFLNVLEQNDHIAELDFSMLEQVCIKINNDVKKDREVLPISVNVSAKTIKQPDFAQRVMDCIKKYDISVGLIELEINEKAFIEQPAEVISTIKTLKEYGLIFSLDNYGSNYSVVNILDTFLVDIIKISGDYIKRSLYDEQKKEILRDLVAMAKKFGITVVADGVESDEMAHFADDVGCDVVQGYPLGRPMSEQEYARLTNHIIT